MESITTGGGPKFKIQQSIPSGSVKRAPHVIVRTVDLNDGIEIKRRFGEGSKPLFARDDIAVNQKTLGDKRDNIAVLEAQHNKSSAEGAKSKNRRSTSTASSSPERYRHRDKKHTSPPPGRCKSSERSTYDKCGHSSRSSATTKTEKNKRKYKSKTRSPSPKKEKKPAVKVPYYRDEARERDRLRRLYGGDKDRDRSRSRSKPYSSSKKHSPVSKHKISSSPNRRHSSSRDDYRRHSSSYHSSRREYRYRRSRSRSRSRSPKRRERDSHKNSGSSERNELRDISTPVAASIIPPTPQFIHIPVAVPAEYAYSFPGWPAPQPTWPPSHRPPPPPPSHYGPYPMYPMMAPMRPPPHQAGYGGLPPPLSYGPMQVSGYRSNNPQRFPPVRHGSNNYQPRYKKPTS